MWQDIVFMSGGLMFSLALIPTIRAKEKPHWISSLLTGGILAIFSYAYATLGLYLACGATVATSIVWLIILVQALRRKNRKGEE